MRVINISLSELENKVLMIGFEGENQITQVRIDAAEILTDYPNATPTLIVKPLFGFAYPVIVAMESTDVVWEIDNSVLSFHGDGEIQLTFTQGTVIAKSYVGRIRIKRSLAVNGEAPDPIETWEQAATAKLAEVDAQIDELEDMVEAAEAAKDEAQEIVDDSAADIQAAGATQIAAVQAKGTEVINSIPSDYTELSDDVSGLKSALAYAEPVNLKLEMFNGYIDTNVGIGNVVPLNVNSSYSWYKIVPCHSGDKIYVKGAGTNSTAVAWALVDTDYILRAISPSGAVDENVLIGLDGYVIINLSASSYSGNSVVTMTELLPYVNSKRIDVLSELTSVDITSDFVAGKYIRTDLSSGAVVNVSSPISSANRAYYIAPIRMGEKVVVTGTGGATPRLWAFTDTEYKLLRSAASEITAIDLELTALQDGYVIINVAVAQPYQVSMKKYTALTKNTKKSDADINVVNPFDYGVVGDGVTDDSDALNAAFAAAAGKTIMFPGGTYVFSKTLVILSNTHVMGAGQSTVFKLANTFVLSSIRHRTDDDSYKYPMIRLADNAVSCVLEHFMLKGQTASFKDEPEVGILVCGKDHIINDVLAEDINFFPDDFAGRTYNAPAWGFMIFHAEHIRVTNCKGINCGYEALGTEDTTDCLVDNFEAGFCNQTCLQVHRNSYDITFDSCRVAYELPEGATVRPAFTMHGSSDEHNLDRIKVSKCDFYGGFTFIGGYENGISIVDNVATGGITMNAAINRKNVFIRGNRLDGGISGRFENAIITENMATNNTGGRFITVTGTNIVCAHNIPLGTGTYVAVNDVAVEQWGTNPPLS